MLDVYPRSESLPKGTDSSYDPYDSVFKPTEEIPLEYFRPRNDENNGERKQRSRLNAGILCVKRKRLSIFGVVLPVDRILMWS